MSPEEPLCPDEEDETFELPPSELDASDDVYASDDEYQNEDLVIDFGIEHDLSPLVKREETMEGAATRSPGGLLTLAACLLFAFKKTISTIKVTFITPRRVKKKKKKKKDKGS